MSNEMNYSPYMYELFYRPHYYDLNAAMKKKLLSLLLVLLMLASLLPASALAANKTFGDFFAGLPLIAETEPCSPNSTKKWKVTTLDGEDVLMSGNKGKSSSSSTLQLTMTADTNLIFG